jgi:hypothetical protein
MPSRGSQNRLDEEKQNPDSFPTPSWLGLKKLEETD